jgi:hypothetical protein
MDTETVVTPTSFGQTLSAADRLGDACSVVDCPGRLDLVYG